MGIAIALALFGVICGAVIHNRAGAAAGAFAAAFVTWLAAPALDPCLTHSTTGRRLAATLSEAGAGQTSLLMLLAAAAFGVLVAWVLFRRREHRPDWEWDPDHPDARERRRRRRFANG
jgi:hypothetical protein